MTPQYIDFRLTLEGDSAQGYVVTAHGPGDTYARAQAPHDLDSVQAVLEQIGAGEAPTPGQMQEVGKRLHDLLFPAEIARLFQQTYASQSPGTHLRLKLHLLTPELTRLPWELAFDGQRFLAARLTHPIVRYIESRELLKLPPLELPLRLLYVQASPHDRDQLDLEASEKAIREAVKGWAEVGLVRSAKPADLLKALHQGADYHILHFDGHGGFDPHRQQGFLVFEDEDGQAQTLEGALLADYLAGTQVRLVVLGACYSGKSSAQQRFVGAAEQLMHDEALPAVVAMQFGIEDKSAIAFNQGFYEALVGGYPVEGAVIAGRKAILDHLGGYEQGSFAGADWASPTLFMRMGEGRLFPAAEAQAKQREQAIRVLVEGVAKLPTDYRTRIQNFLAEYLGTARHKVPFGGRERELAALDAWLADKHAPPYALLAAEAGRGKSALLVRWAARLAEREDVAVVFIPISIRFNTALSSVVFTALAAQLGEIYEEPVPWANLSAEQWKGVCESYLRRRPPSGKPVVVILDGLDEAADWQVGPDLFPVEAVPGVRAVVSARYLAGDVDGEGWQRRLGWERIDQRISIAVPTLERQGLVEVLYMMGNPLDQVVTQVDVVGELYRLTEGDPLLVRLYVEALLSHREATALITPATLHGIRPGLGGYFDKWWEDQRKLWGKASPLKERVVEGVFNLLACALGPLKRDDLLELAPRELDLSSWTLGEALHPLERFIVGDGEQQGYVFNHPRLGYYFRDKLSHRERTFWDERFLAFGKRTLDDLNQGVLPPQQAPSYALQYYGTHLERAKASAEALFALVSQGWLRAWELLDGTYAGFLGDVKRAWRMANQGDMIQGKGNSLVIIQQVRCVLCQASVISLNTNLSPKLFAQAVMRGVLTPTQALIIVQQTPDEEWHGRALAALAPCLRDSLLVEALSLSCKLHSERIRAEVLEGLVSHMSSPQLKEALGAARAMRDEGNQVIVLESLAPHLSPQQLQEVLDTVRIMRMERNQVTVLESLVSRLSPQQLQEALSVTRTMQDTEKRIEVFRFLTPYLPTEQQKGVWQEALEAAYTIQDDEIFPPFSRIRPLPQRFLEIAQAETAWKRVSAMGSFAPYLSPEQLQKVLGATFALNHEARRANVLANLIPYLSSEQLQEVLRVVRALEDTASQIETFKYLALHLPLEQQETVWQEALAAVRTIQEGEGKVKALSSLAPHLPAEQQETVWQEALVAVKTIKDAKSRAGALRDIIPYLPAEQQKMMWQEALAAVRTIQEGEGKVKALSSLAPHLPAEQQETVWQEALVAARAIWDTQSRAKTLTDTILHLPSEQQETVWQEILAAASDVWDREKRAELLAQLVPYLPPEQFLEVLKVARALGDRVGQAQVLASLAPYLQPERLQELLEMTFTLKDETKQIGILEKLLPYLSLDQLQKVLEMICPIRSSSYRGEVLDKLIPYLSAEQLQEALAAANTIWDAAQRTEVLRQLAPRLPAGQQKEVWAEALRAAHAIQTEGYWAEQLQNLTSRRYPSVYHWHWEQAHTEATWKKAEAMSHLAYSLSPEQLQQIVKMINTLEDDARWGKVVHNIASSVTPQHLQEIWEVICALENESRRGEGLKHLAPYLSPEQLQDSLLVAHSISSTEMRVDILGSFAPYLRGKQQEDICEEALSAARTIRAAWAVTLFRKLAPHLIPKQLKDALETINGWDDEGNKVEALSHLAPHLPFSLLPEALALVRTLRTKKRYVEAASSLAPHLPELQREAVLGEVLSLVWTFPDEKSRIMTLSDLAPHLPPGQLSTVLNLVRTLRDEKERAAALNRLVPHLPQDLLHEAIALLRTFQTDQRRAVLNIIVAHLSDQASSFSANTFSAWCDVLHHLENTPRPALLQNLKVLLPFALSLAGGDATKVAEGIAEAILEVGSWWP